MYISDRTVQSFRRVQNQLDRLHPEDVPRAYAVWGSPEPRSSIIVFPGSFNPPTNAHIALLKQAAEHKPIEVYAAMSKLTIDKETVERPTLLDRIMLLKLILRRRLPQVGILLFNRGLYVEQAQAIRRTFPKVKRIYFLVGFDKIVQILDPRYYADRNTALTELFRLAELLVAPRGKDGVHELNELIHEPQNEEFACYIHPLPFDATFRDISSTRIRRGDSDTAHDVPQEVREFMRKTRAYAPPVRRADGTNVDCYEERVKYLNTLLKQ